MRDEPAAPVPRVPNPTTHWAAHSVSVAVAVRIAAD